MIAPPRKAASSAGGMPPRAGLGHAGVGAHRDVHADEAGGAGEQAADGEADGHARCPAAEISATNRTTPTTAIDRVLAVQVGRRALLHGLGDALHHALVAGRQGEQRPRRQGAVDHGEARADQRDDDPVVGQEVTQGKVLQKSCMPGTAATQAASGSGPSRKRAAVYATTRPDAVRPSRGRRVRRALLAGHPEAPAGLRAARRPRLGSAGRVAGPPALAASGAAGRLRRRRLPCGVGHLQLRSASRTCAASGPSAGSTSGSSARTPSTARRTCSRSRSSSVPGARPGLAPAEVDQRDDGLHEHVLDADALELGLVGGAQLLLGRLLGRLTGRLVALMRGTSWA